MTFNEFRSNPKLVKAAGRLATDQLFRYMMEAVWSQHPMFMPMSRNIGCQQDNPAYQLGTVDGANRVIAVLKMLAEPASEGKELKETYQPPES